MKRLLLILSPLMIASCASNGLSLGGERSIADSVRLVLQGGATPTLTPEEKDEILAAYREALPEFPLPSVEAIQAIREANNTALNLWVQKLTILCRQLDEEC